MNYEKNKIESAIKASLEDWELEPGVIDDIAFHMTDWLEDLDKWHRFCSDPASLTNKETANLLMDILIHVPPHIAAARKLMMGMAMEDIFGVNIFVDEEE
ncbi:MAG: hypothetical protein J5I65_18310 [Aridibacter famidurans]|nr:hypothetical protein [Aridibacter famidurans]